MQTQDVTTPSIISAKKELLSRDALTFFVLLLIGQCAIYFSHPNHFFQTDTIWGFDTRLHSFSEIVRSFVNLDPGGWYRPLTNRMIQTVFYPVFGLQPVYYHLLLIPVFFVNSVGVFYLTLLLTGRRFAAGIAATFYSLHTVNAYVTYDVAFFVELFWGTCYIGSAIAMLHYIRSGRRIAWWISLAFFVLGLLSKEPEVTLPATLVVLCFFETKRHGISMMQCLKKVAALTAGHFVVLVLYLFFVIGYLHVGGAAVSSLFSKPQNTDAAQYHLVLDKTVVANLDMAFSWAFNMPRGWHAGSRNLSPWMVQYLGFFRAVILVLAGALLFSKRRKIVFIGIVWFVISIFPMLPLLDHFIPYYIYVPMVGISMIVGAALDMGFDAAKGFPRARIGALSAAFTLLAVVNIHSIRNDVIHHVLMGNEADTGFLSVTELRRLHPTLEPNTRLFFIDEDVENVIGYHLAGALFRVMYADPTLRAEYSRRGQRLTEQDLHDGKVIVLKVLDYGRFEDVTRKLMANPEWLVIFKQDPSHILSLSSSHLQARSGDSVAVTITGLSNCPARLFYTLDAIEQPSVAVSLNNQGIANFPVGPAARPGKYRLVGFRLPGAPDGIRADATLTVE